MKFIPYQLSPTLKSLAPLQNEFTVFSHIDHPGIFIRHAAMNSLLSDPRSERFSTSFAEQWLSLDKPGTVPPDAKGEERMSLSFAD